MSAATDATLERPAALPAPAAPRRLTYAQLCVEQPETNQPTELWDGQLVISPSPSFFHQEIALHLYRALYDWVAPRQLGKVIASPIDMVLSDHRVTQPDVAFIARERLGIIQRAIMGPADLAAEVVSLGGSTRDRIEKRDLYEQYGVKEYWIIDPEARTIDVLALTSNRYELVMRAGPGQPAVSRLLPGFQVAADALFANPDNLE